MTETTMRRRRGAPAKESKTAKSGPQGSAAHYVVVTAVVILAIGAFKFTLSSDKAAGDARDNAFGVPLRQELLAGASNTLEKDVTRTVRCKLGKGQQTIPACSAGKKNKIACKRFVSDNVLPPEDAIELRTFASKLMALGGGSGGPTILDLHSSALSLEDNFVNVFERAKALGISVYNEKDFALYKRAKRAVQTAVVNAFGVRGDLFLTKPTFFSRIGNKSAITENDEYWHTHVDRYTYGSFDYTCLLYLSTMGEDFDGGEFLFEDQDVAQVVHPRTGRVSCFTSGAENPHRIEPVVAGVRYALTIAFTCDKRQSIADPNPTSASTGEAIPDTRG
eukprot:m.447033 g.447033  ORF g.447033 m.447033 type:complete len:335 (+) comp21499_c0_seq4:76-1080(+)